MGSCVKGCMCFSDYLVADFVTFLSRGVAGGGFETQIGDVCVRQVAELEKCQQAENQSELEALLDQTRQDKARCDQRLASLQESLALSQNEATRLRESLATKEEELKVACVHL